MTRFVFPKQPGRENLARTRLISRPVWSSKKVEIFQKSTDSEDGLVVWRTSAGQMKSITVKTRTLKFISSWWSRRTRQRLREFFIEAEPGELWVREWNSWSKMSSSIDYSSASSALRTGTWFLQSCDVKMTSLHSKLFRLVYTHHTDFPWIIQTRRWIVDYAFVRLQHKSLFSTFFSRS